MPVAEAPFPLLIAALRGHVAAARAYMQGQDEAEKIHVLRTGLKRLRAYRRLLRPLQTRAEYARENRKLKTAARALAPLREAAMLRNTLRKLEEKSGTRWKDLPLATGRAKARVRKKSLAEAFAVLSGGVDRFARIDAEAVDRARMRDLLEASYHKARKAGRDAERAGDARLHEWRKRVKDHMYQLEALQTLASPRAAAVLKKLDRLQDRLGDMHDLAVLRRQLRKPGLLSGAGKSRRGLDEAVDKERRRLRKQSLRHAKRLFSRNRFRAYFPA